MRSARSTTRQLPPPDAGNERDISLDQIRPHPRVQNEYVDGPKVKPVPSIKAHNAGGNLTTASVHRVSLPRPLPTTVTQTGVRALDPNFGLITPISAQPTSINAPLKKDLIEKDDEIICSKCGKCKCGSCTEPQGLPSKWLCGDKVQVSPDKAVDTITCFCCVKGIFYHCGKDEQEGDYECFMDPCACCSKPHCFKRWTCLAAMSVCLPCLCCYWPAPRGVKGGDNVL